MSITTFKPIFLIGPTHVGKSFHARQLSQKFRCTLFDLDSIIEKNAGVDIPTIFDFEGEEGFREREHKALASIDPKALSIVATGAGVILRADNRQLLQQGHVIYLHAPISVLLSRIKKKSNRPLFNNKDPEHVLQQMQRQRAVLYEQCAHFSVEIGEEVLSQKTNASLMRIMTELMVENNRS